MRESRKPSSFPARPTLTPLFSCALAFWGFTGLGFSSLMLRTAESGMRFLLAGFIICVLSALLIVNRKTRMLGLVLVAACVGFCLGVTHGVEMHRASDALENFEGAFSARVLEDGASNGYGESALVRATFPNGRAAVLDMRVSEETRILAGERYDCRGAFSPYDYERKPNAWSDGSCGYMRISALERTRSGDMVAFLLEARAKAIEAIGASTDGRCLLQALVCGYRGNMRDTEAYAAFQTCGLAHLVAVSGAHLVIVTGVFAAVLRRMRLPKAASIAVLISVMTSYYIFAGMPLSALRALVMAALALVSFFGRRRASSLNAIGVGVFGIVLAQPPSSLSASFVLSCLSTSGIVVFAPLIQAWLARTPLVRTPMVTNTLALTLSASMLSQPYACSLFNQLPLVSPLANVLTAPLFPIVCTCGFVCTLASMALTPLSSVVFPVAELLSSAMASLVNALSIVPYASVPVYLTTAQAILVSAFATAALWLIWPRSTRTILGMGAVIAGVAIGMAFPVGTAEGIVMLDVGQGDAILVQSRGCTVLVDTGNQDARLLEQLARNGIAHIDAVLVTHADDDHCGSLDALRKAVEVDCVLVAAGIGSKGDEAALRLMAEARATAREVKELHRGDSFSVGAFSASVVWPDDIAEGGGNADSLCILASYDGNEDGVIDFTALFTGDAEKEELAKMIQSGRVGHVDVLKVGHHGSKNGSTREQMEVLSPRVALVSCGKNNRYGHPATSTLELLDNVGASTFRTDEDGMIRCAFTPSNIQVFCVQ